MLSNSGKIANAVTIACLRQYIFDEAMRGLGKVTVFDYTYRISEDEREDCPWMIG